jgi:hypothetical protein
LDGCETDLLPLGKNVNYEKLKKMSTGKCMDLKEDEVK